MLRSFKSQGKVVVSALSAMFFSLPATAVIGGQITITDSARVSHPVEMVAVSVSVAAQCYPSQKEVLAVSQGAGAKIKAILESYMNHDADSRDRIIAAPGFTSRKTITVYDDDARRNVVVCANGWHAENHFTLNLANYAAWPQLQADILGVIDSYQAAEVKPAVTTITLNEPVPMLYPETRDQLLMDSRLQALTRASRQFAKIAEKCHLRNHQIASITPLNEEPKLMYATARSASMPDDSFQPVFDMIYMNAGWQVLWTFVDAGDGCAN